MPRFVWQGALGVGVLGCSRRVSDGRVRHGKLTVEGGSLRATGRLPLVEEKVAIGLTAANGSFTLNGNGWTKGVPVILRRD